MKSLIYTLYNNGQAGLSNLIMSLELAVVLAHLTDRVLVLKHNTTPTANVVRYGGSVWNTYPSRVTDLIDLGLPWIDADRINLAAFAPHEICDHPAWDCVLYFPAQLSTESHDFRCFAGRRSTYITVGEDLEFVPALSFSGGPESKTLSFYSYFFYLDRPALLRAHDALANMKPKDELAAFASRVAESLGPFNAVHIRRGDFKKTKGVTTLNRTPAEAIAALDDHFRRNDRLVILTDEADDPFFDEIRAAYTDHVFIDQHILKYHEPEFLDLPTHDSIALAYLSQLISARSRDFIGTMTSTFTALIQRMRGNLGQDEPFKFLWNELPGPSDKIEPGRHPVSDCIVLDKGIMVEERQGPYSWNRYNERINPAWMREWPEGFLNEIAMTDRAAKREVVTRSAAAEKPSVSTPQGDGSSFTISFLGGSLVVGSNCDDVTASMRQLFEFMVTPSNARTAAVVRLEAKNNKAELRVDGNVVGEGPSASALLRSFYREIVCQFIDRHPNLVWLHAGCAASPGGAVLLPGAWGRGKSSLIMELCNRGWLFLSDDVAPLEPESGTMIPFPGTPQIRSGSEKELPREKLGNLPKLAVSLDPAKVANGPRPLAMIVFPHYAKGVAAKLTLVAPGQAVGELLENCLSFAKNEDTTIRRLCTVVETLPVYALHFGHAGEAAELLIAANSEPADA